MPTTLYLGPPGTGKTTKLLSVVSEALVSGMNLSRIGYMSFTKAAVSEAVKRLGQSADELEHFRTMHAECFRLLGLSTSMVMGPEHYRDLGDRLGVNLTGGKAGHPAQASLDDLSDGDRALGLVELARLRDEPLDQAWARLDQEACVDWALVSLVSRALRRYRELNFLVDFTGMLEEYLRRGPVPELDLLVVDEAQDLSRLQWRVLEKLSSNTVRLVLAGDDDQAIYRWAGVRPEDLIGRKVDRTEVLGQSWRLPRRVHERAQALVGGIANRLPKTFRPRDEEGSVDILASLEEAPLGEGKWLVLVRNRFLAAQVVERCLREGVLYEGLSDSPARWPSVRAASSWETLRKGRSVTGEEAAEVVRVGGFTVDKIKASLALARKEVTLADLRGCGVTETQPWFEALAKVPSDEAEYIRAMLRRGERLRERPRVKISTIHGAKGAEEDNVLLLTDQSYRTWSGAARDPDDETRVFYVGMTRARKRLQVLQPQTRYFFNL